MWMISIHAARLIRTKMPAGYAVAYTNLDDLKFHDMILFIEDHPVEFVAKQKRLDHEFVDGRGDLALRIKRVYSAITGPDDHSEDVTALAD